MSISIEQQATAREREYIRCATKPGGDIHEHLPRLRALASGLDHVTELGTRWADGSTVAFLAAQPTTLSCFDINDCPDLDRLRPLAGRTHLAFTKADVLRTELVQTDLLFIDTWHRYAQLSAELWMHGAKARRYIVLHDTVTFGYHDEDGAGPGLWLAVEEFCAPGTWRVSEHYENNNGLTILTRT